MSEMFLKKMPKGFLVKTFLKHNVIFSEGSRGDTAFILAEGSVEISSQVGGRKKVFAVLKPVSIFGEMALFLEDNQRTATAIALEDSRVILVSKESVDDFFAKAPAVISSIMDVLVHRLKATTKKALKTPNVPLGICRILNLFALNGQMEVGYDAAVRTFSETFLTAPESVEQYLAGLAGQKHISVGEAAQGKRVIRINTPDFLNAVLRKPD
jgi:CRP-like cAMP-binding protein